MFGGMIAILGGMMAEQKARKDWLDSLPKPEADKIRADDNLRAREQEKHNKALEIANAGRARNFWGD